MMILYKEKNYMVGLGLGPGELWKRIIERYVEKVLK